MEKTLIQRLYSCSENAQYARPFSGPACPESINLFGKTQRAAHFFQCITVLQDAFLLLLLLLPLI